MIEPEARAQPGVMRSLVVVLLLIGVAPAMAQTRPNQQKIEIDNLLTALKAAPTEEAAAALESRIRELWAKAGSPAATLLMGRGQRDLQNNAVEDALADYDAVLDLEPDLPAAYDRRALARSMLGDSRGAIADIEAALTREPRDFVAFQGLSHIAEERGDWKGALAAWEKSLELTPKTPDGQKRLQILRRKAYGEAT